ncbi:MAG TPA: hypothetical protein VGK14_14415 [Novimethylophilus sp.]|jgi:hypothetical protein|uniref:hypothetical protein n=1 Tax=Novimethylophilus sp. TaxID=2137426 RepID=UPI002F413843
MTNDCAAHALAARRIVLPIYRPKLCHSFVELLRVVVVFGIAIGLERNAANR